MGPEYWKPQSPFHLKKCSEFVLRDCGEATADCCRVLPCTYCLIFTGSYEYFGTAVWTGSGWAGSINGHTFFGYWERNAYTEECEFVVLIDGYEVYRKSCYEGQSCRDSSDSVYATLGTDEGTLAWVKYEPRPLEYVIDPDTGCRVHFCGSCECTCECLCVTVIHPYGEYDRGQICDTAYHCDAPLWEGTVGDIDLSITLGRDEYGNCVLNGTADYETLDTIVTGCSIGAEWTLSDGTRIIVTCMECACELTQELCCDPRCEPLQVVTVDTELVEVPGSCDNPLPLTLSVDLTATPSYGSATCFNGSGTLTFRTPLSTPAGENCWEGPVSGTCTDCHGNPYKWSVTIKVCCNADTGQHNVSIVPGSGRLCPATTLTAETISAYSCDPFLVQGCFPAFGGCWVACLDDVTPIDPPFFTVCFDIYETPS
jgi:hypothetical protein